MARVGSEAGVIAAGRGNGRSIGAIDERVEFGRKVLHFVQCTCRVPFAPREELVDGDLVAIGLLQPEVVVRLRVVQNSVESKGADIVGEVLGVLSPELCSVRETEEVHGFVSQREADGFKVLDRAHRVNVVQQIAGLFRTAFPPCSVSVDQLVVLGFGAWDLRDAHIPHGRVALNWGAVGGAAGIGGDEIEILVQFGTLPGINFVNKIFNGRATGATGVGEEITDALGLAGGWEHADPQGDRLPRWRAPIQWNR